MDYSIWLSFNNKAEKFQIPVNPASIEISDGSKGQTYDITKLGEINVIGNPKLTEYSFSSFFPAPDNGSYPFASVQTPLPHQVSNGAKTSGYVYYLTKWMESKRPIRFEFTGDGFHINTAASIEDFQWKETAGSGGDIEYTLKLKKYVFYAAKRTSVVEQGDDVTIVEVSKPRPDDRQPPQTYTLAAGDTLWKVAKRFFDDGSRWPEIQKLNRISDAEIKRLQIGRVLQLPAGVTAHD